MQSGRRAGGEGNVVEGVESSGREQNGGEPMLKMFPRPKRTGSGRGHAIVFIIGDWVPILAYQDSAGQCILAFVSIEALRV